MNAAMPTIEAPALLPNAVLEEINHWIAKFPPEHRQSAVLPALLLVQEHNQGWLSAQLLDAVARHLEMPSVAVYEVATFYSMYELKPVGRYKLEVCTNVSCMLAGCEEIVQHLQARLGIGFNATTPDGKFTLREVECLGACANAPMLQLGKQYYENLTVAKIDTLLAQLD